VINNIDQKAFIYRNKTLENRDLNFIKIKFDKNPKNLNAKVTLYTGNTIQYQEYHNIRGYWSSIEPLVYFGLDEVTRIDSMQVEWLYGVTKTYKDLRVNQTLHVSINDEQKTIDITNKNSSPYFVEQDFKKKGVNFVHKENKYWDFSEEILLPHRQSTNGPHISVGDVNGDKLDDFFVGGAKDQIAKIYLQNNDGTFMEKKQPSFLQHVNSEDIGSVFFDFDNDNDLDLYIVSGGGGEMESNSEVLKDRLYENDGRGNFAYQKSALRHKNNSSGSRVKAIDFDKDGDLDLFVGGRIVPGNYPVPAKSIIWENKGTFFEDITAQFAPELENIGLVTDFEWVDLNQDGLPGLVVVGEWMKVEFFEQLNGKMELVTDSYLPDQTRGWWFSIKGADMDKDGDIDFIVGNLGLNNKFHASDKKPFEIYFNDFDENGTNDIVLAKIDEGEQYLLRGKDCSSDQMPFIKDKFPKYEAFANATIEQVLSKPKLDSSLHYSINCFESIFLENINGTFKIKSLPIMAQIAPIQDILIMDYNNDKHLDFIIAGNLFGTEVETPSYDSGMGYLFIGDGNNNFTPYPYERSGIHLPKDVRDLESINISNSMNIIVANNNDAIQLIKHNEQ